MTKFNHTGVVRDIDDLGRIYILSEMRHSIGIDRRTRVEISLSDDGRCIMITRWTGNMRVEALLTDALYMLKDSKSSGEMCKLLKNVICDALDICQRMEENNENHA